MTAPSIPVIVNGRIVWPKPEAAVLHAAGQLPRPDHVEPLLLENVRDHRRDPMYQFKQRMREIMAPVTERMREALSEQSNEATRAALQMQRKLADLEERSGARDREGES